MLCVRLALAQAADHPLGPVASWSLRLPNAACRGACRGRALRGEGVCCLALSHAKAVGATCMTVRGGPMNQAMLFELLGVHGGVSFSADLHVHSTVSDGSETAEQLVSRAAGAGITHLAFTNHDTTRGIAAAQRAGRAVGVTVVGGIEVSAYDFRRGSQSSHSRTGTARRIARCRTSVPPAPATTRREFSLAAFAPFGGGLPY